MLARVAIGLLMSACLTLPLMAQQGDTTPELVLESHGVYCAPEGPTQKVPAPGTVLGYIQTSDAGTNASVVTTRVPAALGIAFGVSLRARPDQGEFNAQFRVSHPTAIPGKRITESWTTVFSPAAPSLNRFRFEFDDELNIGLWLMEVYHGETLLFRQGFEVVPSAAAADIMAQCSGVAPMS